MYSSVLSLDKYKGKMTQYQGGLRIEKATRQDTGDYFCEVSGNMGYAEALVKLTVLGKYLFLKSENLFTNEL